MDQPPSPAPSAPNVTPQALLDAIAAAGDQPWFPSSYASATGIPREGLDEPLTDLRLAGLVEVVTWVKGRGQGYRLTAAGREAWQGRTPRPGKPSAEPDAVFRQAVPLNLRPLLVVWLLGGVCSLVFFAGAWLVAWQHGSLQDYLSGDDLRIIHSLGAVHGQDLLTGQWYRLLTANFVHIGALHLLANLVALVLLGAEVETVYGRWRLLWLFLCSGVGGISSAIAANPDILLAGSSASIWGLVAALAVWLIRYRHHLQPAAFQRFQSRLLFVIILNVLLSLAPGISLSGHLGGAIWGTAAAYGLLLERQSTQLFFRRLLQIGLIILLLLPAMLLRVGIGYLPQWEEIRQRYQHQQRLQLWHQARQQFRSQVVPHLQQLQPRTWELLERQAILQLLRPAHRRDSATVAQLREQIRQQWQHIEAVQRWLTQWTQVGPPDQLYAQVQDYVAAAHHALQLLDLMLDEPEVPNEATWHRWGLTRRQLEALWAKLPPP
jgi:membrane associated rhomboid family serine protease